MKIFRQITNVLIVITVLTTVLLTYVSAAAGGDLNGDNTTDIKDVELFSQYFAGWPIDENVMQWDAADVNGDTKITRADAMTLARIVAKWEGYEFPIPSNENVITVVDQEKYEIYYETDKNGECKYTVTANDLIGGELYNLYVIKLQKDANTQHTLLSSPQNITKDDYSVNEETILYINQVIPNSEGTAILKDFKLMYETDSIIILSGNGKQKVLGTIDVKN